MNGEASSPLDDNYTRPRHAFVLPDAIPEEDEDVDDEEYQVDDRVDIANRAFVATCKKFARQAEYRRRAAYSFLETYHLHCIYSKSQQILLGIPDAVPVVMFMGDDFMFTPQLVQQQHFDRMQQDYWQEDEEDTTQQSPIIDENAWMSNHHHVVNEEEAREVEEEEEEEDQHYTPLSQEVIHWYRSAQFHQRRPSTIMEEEEEEEEENKSETKAEEYESLADMFPSPPPLQEVAQETIIAMPTEEEGYGTIKSRQISDEGKVIRNYFDTYYASTRLAETAWLVLDTAEMLTQDKQSIPFRQFTRYMVNVWRILFFCVESMLSDLGGLFVSKAS